MKTRNVLLVVGLLLSLGCVRLWGSECRFFRITCLDGGAPENLRITKDEFGQIFLQFDTEDQRTYIIEAADSLSPPPAWAGVSAIVGDGQPVNWPTTRRWSRTFGGARSDGADCVQQTSDGGYIVAGCRESSGSICLFLLSCLSDHERSRSACTTVAHFIVAWTRSSCDMAASRSTSSRLRPRPLARRWP